MTDRRQITIRRGDKVRSIRYEHRKGRVVWTYSMGADVRWFPTLRDPELRSSDDGLDGFVSSYCPFAELVHVR